MAVHLNRLTVVDHFLNILSSDTDQCPLDPLFVALTAKSSRKTSSDLQPKLTKDIFKDHLRGISHIKQSGNRRNLL